MLLLAAAELFWPQQDHTAVAQAAEILEAASGGGDVTVVGTVAACNAVPDGVRLSVSHLTIYQKDNSEQSLIPDIQVMCTTQEQRYAPGDLLRIRGEFFAWDKASNPGQFDVQAYYYGKRTAGTLSPDEIHLIRQGSGLRRWLYGLRSGLRASYLSVLGERHARTLSAISLGEKSWMEREWKAVYQEGGIAHILAISGLHITLVGMCLYKVLRRLGLSFWACALPSGIAVAAYVLMTGAGVSSLRAFFMFALWLGAQVCGRKYDMLTGIGIAAFLVTVSGAGTVTDSAFLLSFGAVLSLAVLIPCVIRTCRLRSNLMQSVVSGAALWAGTLPVSLYFFYQSAPWSIAVNLAVLPLMSALMVFGLSGAFAGLICRPLGIFVAAPAGYLLELFEALCGLERRLPSSVWIVGRPALWAVAAYYGVIAAVMVAARGMERKGGKKTARGINSMAERKSIGGRGSRAGRRTTRGKDREVEWKNLWGIRLLWITGLAVCILLMQGPPRRELRITCLDVGQGDGALIELPTGEVCLIDGGSSSEQELWEYTLSSTVKYYGIDTIDYVFLSHADSDHISGITEYLETCGDGFDGAGPGGISHGTLVLPPTAEQGDFARLCALAERNGIPVLRMDAGDSVGGGSQEADMERDLTGGVEAGGSQGTGMEDGLAAGGAEKDLDQVKPSGWQFTCLAPESGNLSGDRNDDSLVLMLSYGSFRMLFTGDIGMETEQALAASGTDLRADVLKVAHHGSAGSSDASFLAAVSPAFSVISCGAGNRYGHPSDEALGRLADAGTEVLTTMESGAVTVCSDGKTYTVDTFLPFTYQ